jgi:hypothetical protein
MANFHFVSSNAASNASALAPDRCPRLVNLPAEALFKQLVDPLTGVRLTSGTAKERRWPGTLVRYGS